ncbi:MAG: hypothetical protein HUU18_06715 [Phycisphaerales bacterium]|nr:hypothetical protein [Phycisphaerales bacterium]
MTMFRNLIRNAALSTATLVSQALAQNIQDCSGPSPVAISGSLASSIGDINNDGTGDLGIAHWDSNGHFVQVEVRSGTDHALLLVLFPSITETMFGAAIMPAGDFNADGVNDLAVASVIPLGAHDDGVGIVRVYSGATGIEIAYIKEIPGAAIAPEHFKLLGDQDGNKIIDMNDVLLLLANIASGTTDDPYDLDVNKDGVVDIVDAIELMDRIGIASAPSAEASLVMLIQTGEWMIDDPAWPGIDTPAQFQPVQMGLAGCAWCSIKCASSWKKAAENCVGVRDRIWAECEALFPNTCSLEFHECLETRERPALESCVDQAAGVTAKCAKCIKKCMPRPSVR